ncbi:hypothetical protein pEaSNUABM37_00019 [Erwinia phage pEa_SNUABM_37]|nr:hypothetical protein pEaSNUABM37_00019 [Erwinia phage pEa_SNUABM_37]QXO10489.1 hypothetical protein pEaSNUABM48_00019 [Erwinia phage pEa_SNUABM_48]
MAFDILHLTFDPSGVATSNKIINDLIELPESPFNRAIVLKFGMFYVKSLVLKKEDGTPLVKWKDYRPVVPSSKTYRDLRNRTGKDVAAWLMIDTTYQGRVIAEYQAVGWYEGIANEDLIDILTAIANDRRPYYWEDINDLPSAFPPAPHVHNVADFYNWYYATQALLRYASALEKLDKLPSLDSFVTQLNAIRTDINTKAEAIFTALQTHYRLFNNPHKVTPTTVSDADLLKNYPMASLAEALAGTAGRYMSPSIASQAAYQTLLKNDGGIVHIGRVPMLQFGDLTSTPIPYTTSGFTLNITAAVPAILASKHYTLPVSSINLASWVAAPASKTLYLYVRVRDGKATYEVATAASPETTTYVNVGTITTNASAISAVAINKVSGVGTVRVSPSKIGSGISVTTGLPSKDGAYAWK